MKNMTACVLIIQLENKNLYIFPHSKTLIASNGQTAWSVERNCMRKPGSDRNLYVTNLITVEGHLSLCYLTNPSNFPPYNSVLRLPHRNNSKIAIIRNLWTCWPVIRPMDHLFKIRQKAFFWILKRWFISLITSQNIQSLQIFAILASFL